MTDPNWADQAACRTHPTQLFFEVSPMTSRHQTGDWHTDKKAVIAAKAVCATCPVTTECLQTALDNCKRHGIWGGLTPRERLTPQRATRTIRRCHTCHTRFRTRTLTLENYCSDICRARSAADLKKAERARRAEEEQQ